MNVITSFLDSIIHGDCVTVMQKMPTASVDLIVTDPPYLVHYLPRDGRRCFNDNSGEWLEPSFREMYRVLKPDSFCVSFYGWPWIDRFMGTWKRVGFRPVSHLVWPKSHCSKRGYTASHHEVAFLLAKGKPPFPENPIRDVLPWRYTGNRLHPNEKPVVAIVPLMDTFSKPNDIVLDPFAGSGTTGVAAQQCGRRFILIEISGQHCATARTRLHQTSLTAKWPSALPVRD